MNNKNLLIGAGVLAIGGLYFWNKNKNKSQQSNVSNKVDSAFSNEDIEKYAKQFSDEYVLALDKIIKDLTLNANIKVPTTLDTRLDALNSSIVEYRKQEKLRQIDAYKKLKNNYGNIYLMFKTSIPKFKSVTDLMMAKNLFIKSNDKSAVPTKEEQIWMANNQNLGETFGFEISIIRPESTKTPEFIK